MNALLTAPHTPSYMRTSPQVQRESESYTRARRDAQRSMAWEIPSPREYAQYMASRHVVMLLAAYQHKVAWYVNREAARELREYGLVEIRGTALTAFGMHVRRELKAMDA